jgi:hypothetical protein
MEDKKYFPTKEIVRNDIFFQERERFVQSAQGKEIITNMNTKNYFLSKTHFPPEIWEEHGERMNEYMHKMFFDFAETPDGWLCSMVDVFSNLFILKLLFMGFRNVEPRTVMQDLITRYGEHGEGKFQHYLEYSIAAVLSANRLVDIYVFENGKAEIVEYQEAIATAERTVLDSHITIPIKALLQRLLWHEDLRTGNNGKPLDILLNPEHNRVILDYSPDTDKMTVHFKNGEIYLIERELRLAPDTRLGEALGQRGDQDITVKKRKGKTVSVRRRITEKFK